MRRELLFLGSLGILAGCGGKAEESAGPPPNPAAANAMDTQEATAEHAPAQTKINCDTVEGQTAPEGQSADDILGIREGMRADQVRAVLTCKNPNYVIEERTDRISLPDGASASEVVLTADSGLDKVTVSLIGPPDREEVVHIARTVEYVEGNALPVAMIEQELERKYGSFDQPDSGRQTLGYIIHTRGGQRISRSNSLYSQCKREPASHGNWQDVLTTKCGEVIRYQIQPNDENENVAFRFSVGVTNFATASHLMAQSDQAAEQEKAAILERAENSAAGQGLDL